MPLYYILLITILPLGFNYNYRIRYINVNKVVFICVIYLHENKFNQLQCNIAQCICTNIGWNLWLKIFWPCFYADYSYNIALHDVLGRNIGNTSWAISSILVPKKKKNINKYSPDTSALETQFAFLLHTTATSYWVFNRTYCQQLNLSPLKVHFYRLGSRKKNEITPSHFVCININISLVANTRTTMRMRDSFVRNMIVIYFF